MNDAPLLGCVGLACGVRRPVLVGVDLTVRAGESWFVLGPNGAGKSTLVATLLGLLRPLVGRVLPPGGGDHAAVGYVPQEPRSELPLPLAVREWVGSALPDGMPRAEADARVSAALTALGMADARDADLRRLSLGQRRRVHIARALARQPRLLVLDEPGANLDPGGMAQLCADLDRLRRDQGVALLHVAHDPAAARRHGTHVALVADGAVRAGRAEQFAAALGGTA